MLPKWLRGWGTTVAELAYKFPNAGAIPHNVVIDKGMVLRYSEIGYDKQAIKDEIIAILGFDPLVPEPGTWGGIKALFR